MTTSLIDDMIQHEQALEQYPWLSAQILNRWRRDGLVRCFKGKEGRVVYPKSDLARALEKELGCEESESQGAYSNTAGNGSDKRQDDPASIGTGARTEADELREKLSLQSIFSKQKKNLSSSSAKSPLRAKPQHPSL